MSPRFDIDTFLRQEIRGNHKSKTGSSLRPLCPILTCRAPNFACLSVLFTCVHRKFLSRDLLLWKLEKLPILANTISKGSFCHVL